MKWLLKLLLGLIAFVLLIIVLVFIIRGINHLRYQSEVTDNSLDYYAEPSNLNLYPTALANVTVEHITGNYLNGFHLIPDNRQYDGVIVTFGGSDGTPSYEVAQALAEEGFEVLALFYYGLPNQRDALTEVPLDFFTEVEDYIEQNMTNPTPLTIYGLSKGAELSLNLVTLYDSIDHAVLVAPASYNFSGLDFQDYQNVKSSWTWEGEPLPFVDAAQGTFTSFLSMMYNLATKGPISYLPSYQYAVEQDPDIEAKRIKVEESEADLLIFAGGDDLMWQSAEMAEIIEEARPTNTEVIIYDEAGHLLFGERIMGAGPVRLSMGGTTESNQIANEAYMSHLLTQLTEWHPEAN